MSRKQSDERTSTRLAVLLRLIAGLCGFAFLIAEASPDDSPADDISLPADHGYVLIRIIMEPRFRDITSARDHIVFDDYDTDESFTVRTQTPYKTGVNTWLSLTSATEGHYYYSRHVFPGESGFAPPIARTAVPADDIFEVKRGVVNYVGDWGLKTDWGHVGGMLKIDVTYEFAVFENALEHFPEHLRKYGVFISMKGRQAISLTDFLKIVKQHSESADE